MRCSHNMPYEMKCSECVKEALDRVKLVPQTPAPDATQEQRSSFYTQAYRDAHPLK